MAATPAAGPLLLNGNAVSKQVRARLTEEVARIKAADGTVPQLAVILVGSRADSQTYVNMKTRACAEVGIGALQIDLPETATTDDILAAVQRLNADPAVSGILVQLPLPAHCDADRVIAALSPLKDADGLTQSSAGALFVHGLAAPLIPCTPLGCLELLDAYGIAIEGRHAVVIGRSNLVGKPVAQLLLARHATVTTVHSRTERLAEHVRRADIVVAAVGKPEWVQADWLKEGAVVLDVGINAKDDPTRKAGHRLVGDVDFERAKERVSAITPVPGGVGPMTVAMLIRNTVTAYRLQKEQRSASQAQ